MINSSRTLRVANGRVATLRIATRRSPLAVAQAELVAGKLMRLRPSLQIALIKLVSTGDRMLEAPLSEVGGKGLFTKELDTAIRTGKADLAVHSAKDLETSLGEDIEIAAIAERDDPRDVWICKEGDVHSAPCGLRFGTASLRRRVQMMGLRPDFLPVLLRGNVASRLRKLEAGEVDATMLALAGLKRLGIKVAELRAMGGHLLDVDQFVPAVGQGAIAVTIHSESLRGATGRDLQCLLAECDDPVARLCVTAERAMLAVLDGSCHTPIAGHAVLEGQTIRLCGFISNVDGSAARRVTLTGAADDPEGLGKRVAAALLDQAG
ncbi:MAG: hydroxymethylbilane synthase [Pseudomonadota bacterium]